MTAAGLTLPDTIQGFLSQQERLVRAGQGQRLDFTMDYLHYLCLKDIADCKLLLDSLDSDSKRKIINLPRDEAWYPSGIKIEPPGLYMLHG